MKKTKVLIAVMVLALCACQGAGGGGGAKGKDAAPENTGGRSKENEQPIAEEKDLDFDFAGLTPEQHYRKLAYFIKGDCLHGFDYYMLSSSMYRSADLRYDYETRKEDLADIRIAILDNNKFYYQYREYKTWREKDGRHEDELFKEEGEGVYEVTSKGRIVLGKWGVGEPIKKSKDEGLLRLTFTNKERPDLFGKYSRLGGIASNQPILPGTEFRDLCK